MVLERAGVELVVGAAEVELGAGGGEVEAEDALVNGALVNGGVEEGVLWSRWSMRGAIGASYGSLPRRGWRERGTRDRECHRSGRC